MRNKFLLFLLVIGLCQLCQIVFPPCALAKNGKPNTPFEEYKYQQKVLRAEEVEKYERSLMPESGCMTTEEYENLSKDVPNSEKVIPEYTLPKDTKMKYIPQPIYKLVRYNNPPGSPDLKLERRFKFDRQVNGGAITSPNRDIMAYPVIYYYVINQCTAGDIFVIPLDKTLPDVSRVLRANVVKRWPEPILSTVKDIGEKYTFRTMTPIDFSPDGSKLVAKEKIGNANDGVWKTNLWVYDFTTQKARNLSEIRDAIRFYWANTEGLVLDEKRWDITPLGFDAEDPNRIIVSAFGYTGKAPKFLGNWSIDCQGQRTMLVSLFEPEVKISINGFKAVQSGVVNPADVYTDEKNQKKLIKQHKKEDKKENQAEIKKKKNALKTKLKEMKAEEAKVQKQYNKQQRVKGPTGTE